MRQFLFVLCLAIAATAVAGCDNTYTEREQTLKDEIDRLQAELSTLKGDLHASAKPAHEPAAPTTGTAQPSRQDTVMSDCMKNSEIPAWKHEFLGVATPTVTLATFKQALNNAWSDIETCDDLMKRFIELAQLPETLKDEFPEHADFRPSVAEARHKEIVLNLARTMAEIATLREVIPSGYFANGGEADRGYHPRHHVVKELVDFLEGHGLKPEEVKEGLTGNLLGAALNRGVRETYAEWKSDAGYHPGLRLRLCEERELFSAEQIKALDCNDE